MLLTLSRRHACATLYFNREYEVNELRRDHAVTEIFEGDGREVLAYTDQVVVDVGELRTQTGGWYKVFTPFKRKWCEVVRAAGPPRVLSRPRRQVQLDIKSDRVPSTLKGFAGTGRPDLWPEGAAEARKRLKIFVSKRIGDYHHDRDYPALDGTSTLSAYLAIGVISPRQCLHAALEANNNRLDSGKQGIATWITELIWREFYRHVLIGFPHVCRNRPFKRDTDKLPWRHDEEQFAAWCAGQTGFPLVDAGMRQLAQTGWMHNRLRMVVAMFLTKDLFIDWRWGEHYFMQHLVDADFASNNGGWQWSASTGTDAAPYFRVFNPLSQSKRYDSSGSFIRRFVPELAELPAERIHDPHARPVADLDYPPPIVDRRRTRELVTQAFRRLTRTSSA